MSLAFTGVNHSYGTQAVLKDVSLSAERGEILCLLGPSGSGKTTLLRLAAGLEVLQSGAITLDQTVLADASIHTAPEQRGVGLVFQDHVLYPHLTVAANVAFGLNAFDRKERREIVARQLASVDLSALADRYPHTLSGGQQQRVALARALAPAPAVMLLDEPFASVDGGLRRRLREQARLRLKSSDAVTLVVTHDAEEAMELGDRIAYLWQGQLAQLGTPLELWQNPASIAVALAFGEAQQLTALKQGNALHTPFGTVAAGGFTDCQQRYDATQCQLVIRPQSVQVVPASVQGVATVVDQRFVGSGSVLLLRSLSQPDAALLRVQHGSVALATNPIDIGQQVAVSFNHGGLFAYDG